MCAARFPCTKYAEGAVQTSVSALDLGGGTRDPAWGLV